MSEPQNTTSSSAALVPVHHYHHHHEPQQEAQLIVSPAALPNPSASSSLIREYRKGNWTLHETLVLITAKKMDDERRTTTKSSSTTTKTPPLLVGPTNKSSSSSSGCRSAELRWKWVENYCWKNGCMRSQNQCNDKWDNLLRDYKKVREYESRSSFSTTTTTTSDSNVHNHQVQQQQQHDHHRDGSSSSSKDLIIPSYWQMEKHERKERNLPTNLLFEVFQALNEVVQRRYLQRQAHPKSSQPSNIIVSTTCPPTISVAIPPPQALPHQHRFLPPPPLQPPQSLLPPPVETITTPTTDSTETEGSSERLETTDRKRQRKVRKLGASITRSSSVLTKTLIDCEEMKEKRHQHIIQLEERKLQIEEAKIEVNKQGFNGIITAINNLSGAIQSLVSSNRQNNAI
ncbi:hypothetical protein MKW98_006906 [Papaver atlanticum]|uniref:Myb/SANT-like DNA-binding domain-containing protein n=1 Tax=Papaver atlanticum TaxID=357466 RepID=A0AAD4ST14_9MAGN|nr:hypothetical protein MKW98_006906 [Papaver atlanticum]